MTHRNSLVGPVVLITIGSFFLARNLFPELWYWFNFSRFWPVILIVIGVTLLIQRLGGRTL